MNIERIARETSGLSEKSSNKPVDGPSSGDWSRAWVIVFGLAVELMAASFHYTAPLTLLAVLALRVGVGAVLLSYLVAGCRRSLRQLPLRQRAMLLVPVRRSSSRTYATR